MLSPREAQALDDIEEHLRADESDLTRFFEQVYGPATPSRSHRVCHLLGLAVLALGLLLFVPGFVARNADAALAGALVLVADAVCWTTLAAIALIRSRRASSE